MGKICFAVLAHDHRDCLVDLIDNLHHFEPGCSIVLFNGGNNERLFDGLNALVCPYSTPIKYRRPQISTLLMMQWVRETKLDYEYFILIDHDMLLLRKGLSGFLDREMKGHEYMGLLKGETGLVTPELNWGPGRKILADWENGWKDIFSLPSPYGCFNPAQVFRKSYVEKFLKFKRLDQLLEQINHSRLSSLGELIFATMAYVLHASPKRFPFHDKAIRYRKPHSSEELKRFLLHEEVYLIHPVAMKRDTQARRFVRLLMQDRQNEALQLNWKIEDVDYL